MHDGGGMPSLLANPRFMVFMEPDTGGNATSGSATTASTGAPNPVVVTSQSSSASQGTGGAAQSGTPAAVTSLYDTLPWDEMDDRTRATLEAARADHQRLAGANATLQQELQARQQQPRPSGQPLGQQQPVAQISPYVQTTQDYLRSQGYTDAQIAAQAPVLGGLLENMLPLFREQIGRDFAPVANTVIAHENTANFSAVQQHPQGSQLLADPQVAQEVWSIVEQQTAAGRVFNTEAISNLAKMIWAEHQIAPSQQPQQQQTQPVTTTSSFFPTMQMPTPNRSTGLTYPGAHMRPALTGTGMNPNQPAPVNEDTRAALAQTFGDLARTTGVAPAAFPSPHAHSGRGAQPARQGSR